MASPIRYRVKLTGVTGLIMHRDDVTSADRIKVWREERKRDKKVLKGDDRYPSWCWKTYLYTDGANVAFPTDNLSSGLSKAGVQFSLGGGKKSLKEAAVSSIMFPDEYFDFAPAGHDPIKVKTIVDDIDDDAEFEACIAPAMGLGIILDVKRASVGQSKHVRVRPRFAPGWTMEGAFINTNPDMIPEDQQQQLWQYFGEFVGIGDWRPSAPKKPGRHGKFTVEVTREETKRKK
jgi:hypothetical protein